MNIPLAPHPYANLISEMTDEEYLEFKEDVRQNDIKEPIIIYKGLILDGRHRNRVSKELGIPCPSKEFTGTDEEAKALVISLNIKRRHLTSGQRAIIGARLVTTTVGGDRKSENQNVTSHFDIASASKLVNVSQQSISRARTILKYPDLVLDVEAGSDIQSAYETAKARQAKEELDIRLAEDRRRQDELEAAQKEAEEAKKVLEEAVKQASKEASKDALSKLDELIENATKSQRELVKKLEKKVKDAEAEAVKANHKAAQAALELEQRLEKRFEHRLNSELIELRQQLAEAQEVISNLNEQYTPLPSVAYPEHPPVPSPPSSPNHFEQEFLKNCEDLYHSLGFMPTFMSRVIHTKNKIKALDMHTSTPSQLVTRLQAIKEAIDEILS